MRVGNLGLGTYPSQNARLLYYFLHLNIKIGPTVANQYSSWTKGVMRNSHRKVTSEMLENQEMFEMRGLYDEIDVS